MTLSFFSSPSSLGSVKYSEDSEDSSFSFFASSSALRFSLIGLPIL